MPGVRLSSAPSSKPRIDVAHLAMYLRLTTGTADRLRRDAEGACCRDRDKRVQVLWQLLQEQHEIPATRIVKKCHRRNQQGFRDRCPPYERRCRSRDFSVEKAAHTPGQTERTPNTCLTQVGNGVQAKAHFKDGSNYGERTQRGFLPLAEMARELGQRDPLIGCDIEGRITRAIPAVISDSSGKPGIKYVERRIRGDVSNTDTTPWADMRVQPAQLGTPSYVEASSPKTRSMSPRSISCKAVRPPNTGSGVAMNREKPSDV
jgi:hypothetical protein